MIKKEPPADSLELRQSHLEAVEAMQVIVDKAESEGRDISDEEMSELHRLRTQQQRLRLEIEKIDLRNLGVKEGDSYTYDFENAEATVASDGGVGDGLRFQTSDGRELRSFNHGEPLAQRRSHDELSEQHCNITPGELIRQLVTGDVDERAQTAGSQTAGGYLVNDFVSRQILDLARAASVTSRAGARTIPIEGETKLISVDEDPTAYWRGETQAITASDMVFGAVTLRPKVLAAIVPISIELLEDGAGAAAQVNSVLGSVLGLAVDQAVLTGAGNSNTPMGVQNHPDVNAQASVGTPTDYSDATSAVSTILTANYPGDVGRLAWVMHPRDATTYQGLVTGISGDVTPLVAPEWAGQLRQFSTTSIPITLGGGAESIMQIGDFSQIIVGMRKGITISVHESGVVTDDDSVEWNATTQMMRFIRVYMRLDVAILRPTWLVNLTGVTNT